jgi:hypothetical protein
LDWFRRSKEVQPLAAEELTSVSTVEGMADDSERLERAALVALVHQTIEDRRSYAKWLLRLVIVQVIVLNVILIFMGAGYLHIPDDVFKTFAISVFAEVVALPLIVARGLFPTKSSPIEEIVQKLRSAHGDD